MYYFFFKGEDKINVARYHEIGRAVATIMSDELFHEVAYKAKKREHLLAGIDEFLGRFLFWIAHPTTWDRYLVRIVIQNKQKMFKVLHIYCNIFFNAIAFIKSTQNKVQTM